MAEHTNSLQQGDLLAEVAQPGDQYSVIDGDESNDADGVEEGKRGCRNLDLAKQPPVHLCALLHKKAAHLQDISRRLFMTRAVGHQSWVTQDLC